MPSVKISVESLAHLVKEAKKLGITVKDLVDTIILDHYDESDEDEDIEEIEDSDEIEDCDDGD